MVTDILSTVFVNLVKCKAFDQKKNIFSVPIFNHRVYVDKIQIF